MIELINLDFRYSKRKSLFNNMNLHLNAGHICGLLGQNGAGKTSLLRLLSGLVFADQGQISVLAKDPARRQPSFLQDLYYVPEELAPSKDTIQNHIRLYSGFYPRFSRDQLDQYLADYKLDANAKLSDLSYGQKKKFYISFAMASGARLVIMDEPTNGLDIPSKSLFRKHLAAAANEERLLIMSTHQVHDIENLIDRLVIVDDGEIVINEDIYDISKRLQFTACKEPEKLSDVYFSEKTLNGYAVVRKNTDQTASEPNIELLFNAVLQNKQAVRQCFAEEMSHAE